MVRFVRAPICQVGDGEFAMPLQQLLGTTNPEGLQVTEVADVFLNRPPVAEAGDESSGRKRPNAFFNASRAPTESLYDIRKARRGEIERELSFKPWLQRGHLLQDRK